MKDYDKLNYAKVKIQKAKRKMQIAVLGSSDVICSKKAYNMAYEVGEALAKEGVLTLTGGGLGVMEAALKGAKKNNGVTLAIVPWESIERVNDYADVVVATGIGWSRNSINLNSCDGAIIIQGGAGTLNEATYAYMMSKPVVALTPSGGIAKDFTNKFFDERKTELIYGSETPQQAVKLIISLVNKNRKHKLKLTEMDKDMIEREEKQDWKIIEGKKNRRIL